MQALRMRDATGMAAAVRARIAAIDRDVTGYPLAEALEIAGFLSRRDADRAQARDFLLAYLERPRDTVRAGALRGLGELGDLTALAAVETYASGVHPEAVRRAARDAAERLRSGSPSDAAIRDLRREVLDLKET